MGALNCIYMGFFKYTNKIKNENEDVKAKYF